MKNVPLQRQRELDQSLADFWVTVRLLEDYPLPVQFTLQSLPGAGELEQPLGRGPQLSIPHKAHGPHSLPPPFRLFSQITPDLLAMLPFYTRHFFPLHTAMQARLEKAPLLS